MFLDSFERKIVSEFMHTILRVTAITTDKEGTRGHDISPVQANRHASHRNTMCNGFLVWYVVRHRSRWVHSRIGR
jgi:hypothetical protein